MKTTAIVIAALLACGAAKAAVMKQPLPTGQMLTPLAAPGAKFEPLVVHTGPKPDYVADGASAVAVSPDGREMLVLTSGFNRYNGPDGKLVPAQSGEYVLRYAIDASGARWVQTLTLPNSYGGVAWLPDGSAFVVTGGVNDDLHLFARKGDEFIPGPFTVKLGHSAGNGTEVQPEAAGVAVSPDGSRALVANYYNDSVSLIDLRSGRVVVERDLRPGKNDPSKSGVAGGEYPYGVAFVDARHAFVTSTRDREIVSLAVEPDGAKISGRIRTVGEPTSLLVDRRAGRLYATEDNDDRLAIVDLKTGKLVGEPRLGLPAALGATPGKGLNPNGLAAGPGGRLLVTFGGINALGVVSVSGPTAAVEGLVPTGWYPSAVATDRSGRRVFVVNRKSPPGPNPQGCSPRLSVQKAQPNACGAANQYIFQLEKAGLLQFPTPIPKALVGTTMQVADNLGLSSRAERDRATAAVTALRSRIKHVVFVIKENRTYDQVLGDLGIGNGDPSLAILGQRLTPNHHEIARRFVTLDNFYDSGEQSSTGWTWSTAARTTDLLEKTAPVNYAKRGLAYEAEGTDRFVPTAQSMAERRRSNPAIANDPDLLPGPALVAAPDGDRDDERGQGFIWNAAIRAGLSVRNYGMADGSVYDQGKPGAVPVLRDPYKTKTRIWTPTDRQLAGRSDLYFRGFDQKLADYWRMLEWRREFAAQEASGKMPALTLMRISHDHFGDFQQALDRVNTVETEMADNDYAFGMLLESIAQSKFRDSTVVFVIEDDAQNGADHVDARRSIAFVAGAGVRQHALVSTRYTTVNVLKTIEVLLGLKPLGLNDALAAPMADVFDTRTSAWGYRATASEVLRDTDLPIEKDRFVATTASNACPLRDKAYWAAAMKGQDFSSEDRLDTDAFNAALWKGLSACTAAPRASR